MLQVYAFSKENWQRPRAEVDFVLKLLESTLQSELGIMMEQGVKCGFIGDREGLPDSLLRWMDRHDSCPHWVQSSLSCLVVLACPSAGFGLHPRCLLSVLMCIVGAAGTAKATCQPLSLEQPVMQ